MLLQKAKCPCDSTPPKTWTFSFQVQYTICIAGTPVSSLLANLAIGTQTGGLLIQRTRNTTPK